MLFRTRQVNHFHPKKCTVSPSLHNQAPACCVCSTPVRTTWCTDAYPTCNCLTPSNEAYRSGPQVHWQALQPPFPCLGADHRSWFILSSSHKRNVREQSWYRAAVILDLTPKFCDRAVKSPVWNLHPLFWGLPLNSGPQARSLPKLHQQVHKEG